MDMMTHQAKCERAKRAFEARGVSVADWARQHGFSVQCVYGVLNGRTVGKRGEAHKVAVALRIKREAVVA